MRIYKIIFSILILISVRLTIAQSDDPKKAFRNEIDKIMKQKLIDSLGIDEISADKFLKLSQENNKAIRTMSKEKRELMETIESNPDASEVGSKFDKLIEIESNILDKKKDFFQELKSFLTPQQIAKTMILRNKLKKEIRKEFNKHKNGSKRKNRIEKNE